MAKSLGVGDESPMQLYKKIICAGYLLPTFKKCLRQGLKKQKVALLSGSEIFIFICWK